MLNAQENSGGLFTAYVGPPALMRSGRQPKMQKNDFQADKSADNHDF